MNDRTVIELGISHVLEEDWDNRLKNGCSVAVQAHIFYDDLTEEITDYINNIPVPYDLFVSTDSKEKADRITEYLSKHSTARRFLVEIYDNVGRDVIPFIRQMGKHQDEYDYICHLHSKKSCHTSDIGDAWRKYLLQNLLGNSGIIGEILQIFETKDSLGIIIPENMNEIIRHAEWAGNRESAKELFRRLHVKVVLPNLPMFPAGNMFWMRTAAIKDIFRIECYEDMIPTESGQTDGTIMHAIERSWSYLAQANGYSNQYVRYYPDDCPLIKQCPRQQEIDNLRKQLEIEVQQYNEIINSKSWRITKPIRLLFNRFRNHKG